MEFTHIEKIAIASVLIDLMNVDGNVDFDKEDYKRVTDAINAETPTTFNTATGMYGDTKLKIGGTAVCVSK